MRVLKLFIHLRVTYMLCPHPCGPIVWVGPSKAQCTSAWPNDSCKRYVTPVCAVFGHIVSVPDCMKAFPLHGFGGSLCVLCTKITFSKLFNVYVL